jgi:hypothetical protein
MGAPTVHDPPDSDRKALFLLASVELFVYIDKC